MNSKIKVGLITDGYFVSRQAYDLVKISVNSDKYEITHVIIQEPNKDAPSLISKTLGYIQRKGIRKLVHNGVFKCLSHIEQILIAKFLQIDLYIGSFDLRPFELKDLRVKPKVSTGGSLYSYTNKDIEKIKKANLHLLIRAGSGILKGNILKVCAGGIISLHHGDNSRFRGGPPGFWEVYKREKRTGFVIQILNEELDGGDVVYKGYVWTSSLYSRNRSNVVKKSVIFMHRTIESISDGKTDDKILRDIPYSQPLYTTPSLVQQINYIGMVFSHAFRKILLKLTSRKHRWGIAYQFVADWEKVALRKSKKIENPPGRFLADPFLWTKNNKRYCFVEDYSFQEKKGRISAYEINEKGHTELGIALEETFHLSFPFILEHDGITYMCPETHTANDIRLYRCVEFPLKWVLEKILISDISSADSILFFQHNKWWLLTNFCSVGSEDHESELHLFFSDKLLSNKWTAHPQNPVVFDPLSARNGGLIFKNDEIYRVFQKQGVNIYGEALGVARIVNITPEVYEEEKLFEVSPDFFEGIIGTHTYNFDDGLLAIDYLELTSNKT